MDEPGHTHRHRHVLAGRMPTGIQLTCFNTCTVVMAAAASATHTPIGAISRLPLPPHTSPFLSPLSMSVSPHSAHHHFCLDASSSLPYLASDLLFAPSHRQLAIHPIISTHTPFSFHPSLPLPSLFTACSPAAGSWLC